MVIVLIVGALADSTTQLCLLHSDRMDHDRHRLDSIIPLQAVRCSFNRLVFDMHTL